MNLPLRPCIAICIVAAVLTQTPGRESREARDLKELSRLESVWNDAHLRGDAEALDQLWAEDLIVTVPDMPLMDKNEALSFVRLGKMKFRRYQTSDLRTRVYRDTAVVTGQLARERESASKEFEDDWRFTKVYVRRKGRWQVVAWHGSHVGTS
ncbi:MAG: nuclear transport factor 2 family protein [Pyrinomonadaceae bacterium]|nr:nuclear transport factor 2 family protein [Pyrinomonadaceae bacterium]